MKWLCIKKDTQSHWLKSLNAVRDFLRAKHKKEGFQKIKYLRFYIIMENSLYAIK